MRYRLAVLTHGHGTTLPGTLTSFAAQVTPPPADVVIHSDGSDAGRRSYAFAAQLGCDVTLSDSFAPQGFCRSTWHLWREAAQGDHDYVLWLEHDFEFTRPVDLRELATVLDLHPALAQMALMRDAANPAEVAAGGLYELRRDHYVERETTITDPADDSPEPGFWTAPWLEHTAYFTTTPSLMTRRFMADNPWPAYPEQCEGRFGIDLAHRDRTFGVWGDGTPWVRHTGQRSGFGY